MPYSDRHRVVFKRYLADPRVLRQLDDGELNSLLEDANFTNEVACERERRSQPVPAPPTQTIPPKAGGVRTGITQAAVGAITRAIAPYLKDLIARCTTLEQRCTTLEAQQQKAVGVRWRGVFRAEEGYEEGQLVKHAGGLWLTTRTTVGTRPGDSTGAFVLVCKRGDYDRGGR